MTHKAFKTAASSTNMVVAASTVFFITGPFVVERILIPIVDATGTVAWNTFGSLTKLTTGISIQWMAADGVTVKRDYTADGKIQQNIDWCRLAGKDGWDPTIGSGTSYCVRWSIFKSHKLRLGVGETLRITIADATTGIDYMRADAQGYVG